MGSMKTPGVYIVEKNAFPNSVVEAPTAIPAFIGITETAANGDEPLANKPWKISSMTEYIKYFGSAPTPEFTLSIGAVDAESDKSKFFVSAPVGDEKKALKATRPDNLYSFYYNLIMFFANGGGTCYIVSVSTYADKKPLDKDMVSAALTALQKEQEVTMILVPEAVNSADCTDIQMQMLMHCGVDMRNRFSILDVLQADPDKCIQNFRSGIGSTGLSYAAAYYPFLCTSVLGDKDITANMLVWDYVSQTAVAEQPDFAAFFPKDSDMYVYTTDCMTKLKTGLKPVPPAPPASVPPTPPVENAAGETGDEDEEGGDTPDPGPMPAPEPVPEKYTKDELEKIASDLHSALMQNWQEYQLLVKRIKECLNLLPPSAAMAGIYTMIDNTRGVWKAPANVSVNYVVRPSVDIDNRRQEDLNVPVNGKSINAIRSFIGEGIKVWGARTLDGNSLDWRYINVRRTMLFLEESVKNAARAYVFEPNDANTWLSMKCMIENFLRGIWKRGGLAGGVPEDAFSVHVGLGDTMTPEDILEGVMRITVLVAISHPAEFIEITFQQQMQKN